MTKSEIIQHKIYTQTDLLKILHIWKFKEDKIVFTNGCFDLMHLGHIDYLSKAADLGQRLIVGLNTDESTRKLKGNGRPITDEKSRAAILASLFFVDAVVLFDEETPLDLIKFICPDVLVKGADYTIEQIVGANFVLGSGGSVKTIDFLPGYSTSGIENKIRNS
ncbi:MAG: D-glycero-beta-D-manno-heptose 1-phosphate adenylyltransferase [Daejeonella sp.]